MIMSREEILKKRTEKVKEVIDRIERDYKIALDDCRKLSIQSVIDNADFYMLLKWVNTTLLGENKYEWFNKICQETEDKDGSYEIDFYISDRCLDMILECSANICFKLNCAISGIDLTKYVDYTNFESTLFSIIEVAEYNHRHNPQEYEEKFFTKDDISWQTTLVKFKNGLRAICINDKISEEDTDGSKQFMIFNPETREFLRSVNVDCWDNDLHNTLSLKGILGYMNLQMSSTTYQEHSDDIWADTEYDVVAVTKYIYACDAFENLFNPNVNWFYIRKEHGRLGSILTVGEAIKAEG